MGLTGTWGFLTRQRRVVLSPNPISFDKGGFFENIPRMLNKNQKVDITFNFSDWPAYKYFKWIQDTAKLSEENMLKTFNCGIGLIIAISPEDEEMALGTLNQSSFYAKTIGAVYEKQGNEPELNFV